VISVKLSTYPALSYPRTQALELAGTPLLNVVPRYSVRVNCFGPAHDPNSNGDTSYCALISFQNEQPKTEKKETYYGGVGVWYKKTKDLGIAVFHGNKLQ
jgi:hypothetical protein